MAFVRQPVDVSWSMFVAAHRAGRSPARRHEANGVFVYARDASVRSWIEHELFGERVSIQFMESLVEVLARLTLLPPPWAQFLVVDVDAISSPDDIELLAAIRAAGWAGTAIANGEPTAAIHGALEIDRALSRTLDPESLRNAIKQVRHDRPTVPLRRIVEV